jgi:hypothetical protein
VAPTGRRYAFLRRGRGWLLWLLVWVQFFGMDALVTLAAGALFCKVFAADPPSHTGRCFESGHRCGRGYVCRSGCDVDGCDYVDYVGRLPKRVKYLYKSGCRTRRMMVGHLTSLLHFTSRRRSWRSRPEGPQTTDIREDDNTDTHLHTCRQSSRSRALLPASTEHVSVTRCVHAM